MLGVYTIRPNGRMCGSVSGPNMSICLIRPPAVESFRFATTSITPPLGIAYLAAAIEASGRQVSVLDAVGEGATVRTAYYKGYLVGLRADEIVRRHTRGDTDGR